MPCEEIADQFGLDDDDITGTFSIAELLGRDDGGDVSLDDLPDELD